MIPLPDHVVKKSLEYFNRFRFEGPCPFCLYLGGSSLRVPNRTDDVSIGNEMFHTRYRVVVPVATPRTVFTSENLGSGLDGVVLDVNLFRG